MPLEQGRRLVVVRAAAGRPWPARARPARRRRPDGLAGATTRPSRAAPAPAASAGCREPESTPRAPSVARGVAPARPCRRRAPETAGRRGPGAGTSARRARMRLPRRWAAASSGGKTAAADMSSTDPAWMPPISGSTSASTTRCPSLRGDQRPDGAVADRAPARRAGAARRRGPGRSGPRARGCPERAVGQNRVGIPSASPSGRARRRPRAQTDAPAAAIGTSASAEPELAAQVDRLGPAPEEPVGADVDARPPNASLRSAPPRRAAPRAPRRPARRAAVPAPPVSSQAAVRPLMPPPTTTTCPGATSGAPPSAAMITSARTSKKAGSSLSDAVRRSRCRRSAATAASSTSRS